MNKIYFYRKHTAYLNKSQDLHTNDYYSHQESCIILFCMAVFRLMKIKWKTSYF